MYIIKIGGGSEINLSGIVEDLSELKTDFILVLGANALRDQIGINLGIEKKELTSISGYKSVYSNKSAIDLIMMSYAGLRNRRFVELCQQQGINAIGLTGLDGQMIRGRRNPGIRIKEGGKKIMKHDFSGKPKSINTNLIKLFLKEGYLLVLSIPILDEQGCAINSENDDIVNILQESLHAEKIIQLIEAPGFLENIENTESIVKRMTKYELQDRENQVQGRMKRKIMALRRLFDVCDTEVIIADGRINNPIRKALDGAGTVIK